MISPRRVRAVARKELLHLFRDRRMRPIIFVVPAVQLTILGLAANLDVLEVPVAIVDHDQAPLSREIADRVDASPAFDVVVQTGDERVAERLLDRGEVELALFVPQGAQRGLARLERVELPVWIDGTDTTRGLLAQGYLEELLARVGAERLPAAPLPAHPALEVRVVFNPALQSRWFMLPAIDVMVLGVLTMLLSTLAVVKEREKGTIEQLVVTPIHPVELVLGKFLPFVGVGAVVATIVTAVAILVFGLPFRGDPLALAGIGGLFLAAMLGLGLLVSTVSRTQQQAMLSAILVLLPSFLLGGIFYPVSNMPVWAQHIADVIPIRYFVVVVRSIFLKGAGFDVLALETGRLALIAAVVLLAATLRFRKRSA